jgi:hypothetical protein
MPLEKFGSLGPKTYVTTFSVVNKCAFVLHKKKKKKKKSRKNNFPTSDEITKQRAIRLVKIKFWVTLNL